MLDATLGRLRAKQGVAKTPPRVGAFALEQFILLENGTCRLLGLHARLLGILGRLPELLLLLRLQGRLPEL
eukprot:5836165-Amphidinium_carterae.1